MRNLSKFIVAAGITVLFAACDMKEGPATMPAATKPAQVTSTPAVKPPTPTATAGFDLDAKGYIRNWLVLGPINFGGAYNADDIDKEQIAGEAKLTPKEGDKQKVKSDETVAGAAKMVDKELTWTKLATSDYFIDFNEMLKLEDSTGMGAYAVAYLDAPAEMKGITFSLSTNDDGVIYLNGKNIFKIVVGRALAEDSDTVADLTLNKGTNVVIFKVWNDSNNWQGCIRLLDKAGAPVKGVKVKLAK